MPNPLIPPELGTILLTRTWLFQVIISTPIAFFLGICCMAIIFGDSMYIYDFVLYLGTAILALGIIFIVLVQRKLVTPNSGDGNNSRSGFLSTASGRKFTFWCEVGKSVLATLLWGWTLLDAIFNPRHYGWNPEWHKRRIICCCIAFIVLLLFWYPTVWYSHYAMKHHSGLSAEEEEEGTTTTGAGASSEGERVPLLGNEAI